MHSFSTPSKPPVSSSIYIVPSQSPNMKTPTSKEQYASSPWRGSSSTEISTEKQHETFLADFDEKFSMSARKMATPLVKISEFGSPGTNTSGPIKSTPLRDVHMSAGKMATPPPTISGFVSRGTNTSSTTSTPLRAVCMSPSSQKFRTPPWKGEVYLPPPMAMEDSIAVFERLGVYPQIQQWCDHPRQLGDYLRKTKKRKGVVVAQRANDQNRFGTEIVTVLPFVSMGLDPHGGGLKRKSSCNVSAYTNKKCI
nr:hypothetical protein [Tanacetum cinerariifolium]